MAEWYVRNAHMDPTHIGFCEREAMGVGGWGQNSPIVVPPQETSQWTCVQSFVGSIFPTSSDDACTVERIIS